MRYSLCLVFFILMSPWLASAVEWDIQLEKTWWQYQEYAKDASITATQASFLPSKTTGDGAQLQLAFNGERDGAWVWGVSGAWMGSTSFATERWSSKQTNDLSVKQWDVRLDIQHTLMRDAWWGLWVAARQQEQSRQTFVVNGVPTAVAGEPIVEKIRSDWVGLSFVGFGGREQQLQASIDIAVPINVKTTNPLFSGDFQKKAGFRSALDFRWYLPKRALGLDDVSLTLRYQYQELGGEQLADGSFWPYNRWQMLGFGLLYAW